jgi:hypothetical protein
MNKPEPQDVTATLLFVREVLAQVAHETPVPVDREPTP